MDHETINQRAWLIALVAAMVFALPFERIPSMEWGGMTIRISHILAIILLLLWLFEMTFTTRWRSIQWRSPHSVLALFFGLALIGSLRSTFALRSLFFWGVGMAMASMTVVLPSILRTNRHWTMIVRALWYATLAVTIFGLYQFLGDSLGLPQEWTGLRDIYTKGVFGFPRVQSTALEPLYFANFLLLPLGVFGSLLVERWGHGTSESSISPISKNKLALILFLIMTNGILTLSRGGYLAILATAAVLLWDGRKTIARASTMIRLAALCGGCLVLAFLFLAGGGTFSSSVERIRTFSEHAVNARTGPAVTERMATMRSAWELAEQRPWLGIGLGTFGTHIEVLSKKPEGGWKIVNNEPLELLVEHGILGMLTMGIFVILVMWRALVAIRHKEGFARALNMGLFAACVGILVQYQTFSTLTILHVWVAVGLLMAQTEATRRCDNGRTSHARGERDQRARNLNARV